VKNDSTLEKFKYKAKLVAKGFERRVETFKKNCTIDQVEHNLKLFITKSMTSYLENLKNGV
jgi:hypothetical protein